MRTSAVASPWAAWGPCSTLRRTSLRLGESESGLWAAGDAAAGAGPGADVGAGGAGAVDGVAGERVHLRRRVAEDAHAVRRPARRVGVRVERVVREADGLDGGARVAIGAEADRHRGLIGGIRGSRKGVAARVERLR